MSLAVVAAGVAGLLVGARPVDIDDVLAALSSGTSSNDAQVIVRDLRLPRTLLGMLVGAALGVGGALMQAIGRNPLADPGLLGVSAGASLGIATGVEVMGLTSLTALVWPGMAGAAAAATAVWMLGAAGRRSASPVRLVLAGTAITAVLTSLTTTLVLLDAETLDAWRTWVVGSLAGRPAGVVAPVAVFTCAGLLLAMVIARPLDALALGEDAARGLGIHTGRTSLAVVVAVTVLTGAAVAAAGPIAFVGLAVPHAGRVLVGAGHRLLLPACALLGAVLLVLADVAGRVLAPPGELPAGVVCALLGAPVLVGLARRARGVDA